MVDDGTLRSTPTVSDESVLSATARAGLHADSFAATIEVTQLARAQSAYSGIVADRTAAIGQGTMTLSIGGTDYAIAIDVANDSLDGLAAANNTSDSGVTASIIADTGGYRKIVKGAMGEAKGVTPAADGKDECLNPSHKYP